MVQVELFRELFPTSIKKKACNRFNVYALACESMYMPAAAVISHQFPFPFDPLSHQYPSTQ